MRVLLFGATGMVGQGVLRECLLAADVQEVVAVGRTQGRTRAGDRFAALTGWMPDRPKHYPTIDELRARFDAAGLAAEITPWFGNTPFNNWLIVARR